MVSHDVDVAALAAASDVVGFARATLAQHATNGGAVVFDVKPVADVLPVAVHGQRLAVERVVNHQRDELLGKLKRSVVVGAVGGQRREP